MGSNGLQVAVDELQVTANQWHGLDTQLAGAHPLPGNAFQPTAAAVNGVNAAIGVAVAAFTARTQATAAAVAASATGYANQDDTAAGALAAVPQMRAV
jgi:hypothetical protein